MVMKHFYRYFAIFLSRIRITMFVLCICSSCGKNSQYPADVEAVIEKAGNNGVELEKVLAHYAKEKKDSLKLKAAYYLITNMAEASYLKSSVFESYSEVFKTLATYDDKLLLSDNQLKNKEIRRSKYEELWEKHKSRFGDPSQSVFKVYSDIGTISAKLLIENIDYAFKAWEFPWSRHYSFDQFCKYILPYRCYDETLESWRGYYFKKLSPVVDSLRYQTDPVVVAKAINDWLSIDFWFCDNLKTFRRGALKPTDLLSGRIAAHCTDQVVLGNSAMRAMGIATSKIIIPTWGTNPAGHEISAILNKHGKWLYVEVGDGPINESSVRIRAPKVYLQTFNRQYPNVPTASRTPSFSYLDGFSDVTDQFNTSTDITIELSGKPQDKYLYLYTFNYPKWIPVYVASIKNNRAIFKKMGVGMVYLPAYSYNGKFIPATPPVWVDSTGHVTKLMPKDSSLSYNFLRKFKTGGQAKIKRSEALKGGKFQVASRRDFSDAKDVFTIGAFVSYHPQNKPIAPVKARYVRYVFPTADESIKDGPAQLVFYGQKGETNVKLSGTFLSSEGVSRLNLERLFDDDLLTYVCYTRTEPGLDIDMDEIIVDKSSKPLLWVGLDLGQNHTITSVEFCPRNDKNEVYKGKRYELFYWDNQWKSLGVKTATDTLVSYKKIPCGALLLLRNLAEGKEERIFTIQNNKIQWH